MYHILFNNELYKEDENLKDIMKEANILISNKDQWRIIFDEKSSQNILLYLLSENNSLIIKSKENYQLSINNLNILPFLLFDNIIINKLDDVFFLEISKITPETLMNIFTYKCLLDPYILLKNIFKLNEEYIYQSFVLYLNQTIELDVNLSEFNHDIYLNNFFVNSEKYPDKYNKLFMFYLKSKLLYPFMIKYVPYHSKFKLIM